MCAADFDEQEKFCGFFKRRAFKAILPSFISGSCFP
jgi:hypothetical protein